jgi:hypothetical protein
MGYKKMKGSFEKKTQSLKIINSLSTTKKPTM